MGLGLWLRSGLGLGFRVSVRVRVKVRGENNGWPVSKRVVVDCTRTFASKGIYWGENNVRREEESRQEGSRTRRKREGAVKKVLKK